MAPRTIVTMPRRRTSTRRVARLRKRARRREAFQRGLNFVIFITLVLCLGIYLERNGPWRGWIKTVCDTPVLRVAFAPPQATPATDTHVRSDNARGIDR